jgi:hypothetical protein
LRRLDEDAAGVPRVRIWLAREAQDMRCGFDRLAERAVELRASELAMILDGIDVTRLARYARTARGGEEALPAGKVPPEPLAG